MNSIIYAGFIIAGAVTLLIEAYRNYDVALSKAPFHRYAILRDLQISKLCTPQERNFGFFLYSLLYLFAYALILGSTEVYELVVASGQNNAEVGPTSHVVKSDSVFGDLLNEEYGKPIFVSATIISLFSLGAMKQVENTMRSLAQRLSGVPRGIYKVIEELRSGKVKLPAKKSYDKGLLASLFEENAKSHFHANNDKERLEGIEHALFMIDILSVAVTSKYRVQYFPLMQTESMPDLADKIEAEINSLRQELERKVNPRQEGNEKVGEQGSGDKKVRNEGASMTATGDEDTIAEKKGDEEFRDEAWRSKLTSQILSLESDVIAVFAVYFLRNNRAIKEVEGNKQIHKIAKVIKRSYRIEQNALAIGFFLAFTFSFAISAYIYHAWNKPRAVAQVISQGLSDTYKDEKLGKENKIDQECVENISKMLEKQKTEKSSCKSLFEGPECKNDNCQKEKTKAFVERIKPEYEKKEISEWKLDLAAAFWNTLAIAMAVTAAISTAIFGREVRREEGAWEEWDLHRPPALRIASLCLVPSLLAIVGVVSGKFLQLLYQFDFQPSENQIALLFEVHLIYFAMHGLVGFFVAFAAIFLADQHRKLPIEATVLFGLLFGFFVMAFYYLVTVVSSPVGNIQSPPEGWSIGYFRREMIIDGSFPFLILLFFALFAEVGEDREDKKKNWTWKLFKRLAKSTTKRIKGRYLIRKPQDRSSSKNTEPPRTDGTVMNCLVILAISMIVASATTDVHAADQYGISKNTAAQGSQELESINGGVELKIGVRSEARPFSFRSRKKNRVDNQGSIDCKAGGGNAGNNGFKLPGPLGKRGYDGYMIRICDEVLVQLCVRRLAESEGGFTVAIVDIDAVSTGKEDRFDRLTKKQNDGDIDILCDPATINSERVRQHVLSPPLFLTGIGYLQRPPESGDRESLTGKGNQKKTPTVGVVGSSNAGEYGLRAILDAGEWQEHAKDIEADLRSGNILYSLCGEDKSKVRDVNKKPARKTTAQASAEPAAASSNLQEKKLPCNDNGKKKGPVVYFAPDHRKLAEAFCDRRVKYYVGDMEIIKAHVREIAGCDFMTNVRSFTIDRYAIFARADSTGEKAELISSFFEILNRKILVSGSLLDSAYRATFGNKTKTRELEYMFRTMRGPQ